jgi:hypothetical protein
MVGLHNLSPTHSLQIHHHHYHHQISVKVIEFIGNGTYSWEIVEVRPS